MKFRLAFLVLAHNDIDQLTRLMNSLVEMGDIYLHIDKKVKDSGFLKAIQQFIASYPDRITLTKKEWVCWGGFSMCRAEQYLLQAALNSEKDYDRLFFLSGLDYPIFSPAELEQYIEQHQNKEIVSGWNITANHLKDQLDKVRLYHFFRDIKLPQKSFFKRGLIAGARIMVDKLGIHKRPYLTVNGKKWDIYFGSQWISITGNCAKYILEQMTTNRALIRYFKTSFAPDELLIPTIVFNSEFGKNAYPATDPNFNKQALLHHLQYGKQIRTWDENDYDNLVDSRKPFARKLTSGKSEKLIQMLDKRKTSVEKPKA